MFRAATGAGSPGDVRRWHAGIILAIGILCLAGSLWVRVRIQAFRVDSVQVALGLSMDGPALDLVVDGHNPMPVSVHPRRLQLRLLVPGQSAIATSLLLEEETRFPPGDFEVSSRALIAMTGQEMFEVGVSLLGISRLPPQEIPFEGVVVVDVGGIEREASFEGRFRWRGL